MSAALSQPQHHHELQKQHQQWQQRQPLRKAEYVKISALRPQMRGINLVAQVMASVLAVDKPRVDGTRVRIAEVTIADATATVIVRARNEQIEQLPEGRVVVIRNANVEMFRRTMRLVVSKWGKITPYPDGVRSTPTPPPVLAAAPNMSDAVHDTPAAADAAAAAAAVAARCRAQMPPMA